MGIKKVNESRVMIVERLGKYHKQLGPGINFIIPGLDKIKTNINLYTTNVKYDKEHTEQITEEGERDVARTRIYEQVNLAPNGQINMAENVLAPPELDAITSDNAIVHPDLIMYFLIVEYCLFCNKKKKQPHQDNFLFFYLNLNFSIIHSNN